MIDYCYHTHTYRCGHAKGKEEEYVLAAIENGFKVIGFSDHVFWPNYEQPGMRGSFMELDDYLSEIKRLQKKYKNKIEIHTGFECEYSKDLEEYYRFLLKEKGVEYLILGQHLFFEDGKVTWLFSYSDRPDEGLKRYVDEIIKGIETGLFTYVAHPDLFIRMYKEITPFVEEETRRLCEACVKHDIPMEINLGGIRAARFCPPGNINYPSVDFFKIVSEYDVRIIIGVDAHNPDEFEDGISDYQFAEDLIKKFHFHHIERIDFKK